jgi:myosin heavy subunit
MQRRLAKKRLYRHEAVGIIQHNLLAFSKLQTDPWWRLYTRMRPLLTASRAAEEEKVKKAAIAAMEAKIAEEVDFHFPQPTDLRKNMPKNSKMSGDELNSRSRESKKSF